jgi:hypothetical protein
MNQSFFIQYIAKWFQPIVQSVIELINGKKEEEKLLHKTMLTEEYSADLKWGGKEIGTTIVAADVVSMGSSLPLKKRDSFGLASGDVPKIGMKLRKDEKVIKDIQIMEATGVNEQTVVRKIFDDVSKVIKGIDVRKEIMFQQALSTGAFVIEDETNTGTGIRCDFGYKPDHTFRSYKPWGSDDQTPQEDIDEVMDKIEEDGNAVALALISKKYLNYFRNSTDGKVIAANFSGYIYTDKTNLPTPSKSVFLEALEDNYGCKFQEVNSTFRYEKNGVQTPFKPWEQANIVFLPSDKCGRLVWGDVAEKSNPVNGVEYQDAGQGSLISKYSKNDPLEEFTSGQACAIPVIDGVESIYLLEADVEAIALSSDSLTFEATADTTGQKVTVTTDAASITAASDSSFATVSVSKKVVTVKVAANTDTSERTATITITDSLGVTATITVTQEAASE